MKTVSRPLPGSAQTLFLFALGLAQAQWIDLDHGRLLTRRTESQVPLAGLDASIQTVAGPSAVGALGGIGSQDDSGLFKHWFSLPYECNQGTLERDVRLDQRAKIALAAIPYSPFSIIFVYDAPL